MSFNLFIFAKAPQFLMWLFTYLSNLFLAPSTDLLLSSFFSFYVYYRRSAKILPGHAAVDLGLHATCYAVAHCPCVVCYLP